MTPHICTACSPWQEGMGPATHPDAQPIEDYLCLCCEWWHCPHCGAEFEMGTTAAPELTIHQRAS
jgi:hypothetical protein